MLWNLLVTHFKKNNKAVNNSCLVNYYTESNSNRKKINGLLKINGKQYGVSNGMQQFITIYQVVNVNTYKIYKIN